MDRMPQTGQTPGARASRAGSPGGGAGNVPFAGGLISGNLGQQTSPQMGRVNGPITLNINSGGPPQEKPPGRGTPPGPQGPGGPAMTPQMPMINPQAMMDVYNAYFQALVTAVSEKKSIINGIY